MKSLSSAKANQADQDHEAARLKVLNQLNILDTPPDKALNSLVHLAAEVCGVPIALISLVDKERQWFLAKHGLDGVSETPRNVAFCSHTILGKDVMIVADACSDPRFRNNPLVTAEPTIRFYAGAPISIDDHNVGTLCLIDRVPRIFSTAHQRILSEFASFVAEALEARRVALANQASLVNYTMQSERATRQLFLLLDNLPSGVCYRAKDLAGHFSNSAHETLSQGDCNSALRQRDLKAYQEVHSQKSGQALSWEEERITLRGQPIKVGVQLIPNQTPSGELSGYLEITTDITAQSQIMEATGRLAAIVESTESAIIATDSQGRIAQWNLAAEALFGYSFDEVLHRNMEDLLNVDLKEPLKQVDTPEAQRPERASSERKLTTRDGSTIHVSLTGSPIFGQGDQVLGTAYVFHDITTLKRKEQALKSSEARLQRLYEMTPAILHSLDAAGRIISVSQRWLTTFGYSRDEVLGRHKSEFLTAGSKERVSDILRELHTKGHIEGIEYNWLCRDGSVREVLLSAIAEYDDDGAFLRSMAVLEDVTARRRAERALAKHHELLKITFDSIADGVITTNKNGRITSMNPVAERLTGWSQEEASRQAFSEVFNLVDDDSKFPLEVCRRLKEGPVIKALDPDSRETLISRGGEEYGVSLSAAPISDNHGRFLGGVFVFQDVTEARRRTQEVVHKASHDSLTGLQNRDAFETRLEEVHGAVLRGEGSHCLLYIDLDFFKQINDTCGHAAGDIVLCDISRRLRQNVRASDTVARLGGDEFAIILIGCPFERAKTVAQNICDDIQAYRLDHEKGQFQLGASIGLIKLSNAHLTPEACIAAADKACYGAKERGRSQVVLGA